MTMPDNAPLSEEEAARFINDDTTWPPGWSVRASASTYEFCNSNNLYIPWAFQVVIEKQSKNSSYPDESGKYAQPWVLQFPLSVPDFARKDKDALVFWILEKIVWCEEHEAREFCRYKVDGQWYAPFHPHRGDYTDQHMTPEWQAQYRDPADRLIAGRMPKTPKESTA